jgi:hypothetical protein
MFDLGRVRRSEGVSLLNDGVGYDSRTLRNLCVHVACDIFQFRLIGLR